jgi:hypothetical protein
MNWRELTQGPPLRWVQPSAWKMNYQLLRGDQEIATLRYQSLWKALATLENEDGCWTFTPHDFAQTRATIRPCGSDTDIATFRSSWKGEGTLELPGGRQILATTNGWQNRLEMKEASGESLLRLRYDNIWCTTAALDIQPRALAVPETSWIVGIGWYRMVMMQVMLQ